MSAGVGQVDQMPGVKSCSHSYQVLEAALPSPAFTEFPSREERRAGPLMGKINKNVPKEGKKQYIATHSLSLDWLILVNKFYQPEAPFA